jgi:hypothetical protein
MNRIAIILNENGEFDGVVADTEVEVFVVQPSCERDRVYLYGSAQFGPQYVHAAFAGHSVGHAGDDMLAGGTNYGKLPPSRPKLSLVEPDDI